MKTENVRKVFSSFLIQKKKLCKLWITNLKNGKLQIETFKYSSSKVVCEDHFTSDSFERNVVKESLHFAPKRKKLRPNVVPTIVNTGTPVRKQRQRSESSTKKRQQARLFQIRNYIYVGTQWFAIPSNCSLIVYDYVETRAFLYKHQTAWCVMSGQSMCSVL